MVVSRSNCLCSFIIVIKVSVNSSSTHFFLGAHQTTSAPLVKCRLEVVEYMEKPPALRPFNLMVENISTKRLLLRSSNGVNLLSELLDEITLE